MASVRIIWIIISILLITFVTYSTSVPTRKTKRTSLTHSQQFLDFMKKNGYLSEEHFVVTEDGYILRMFRIVQAKNCQNSKFITPVLLMHGLLESSDSWMDSGPNAGLAYLISDACFDLWLGNFRGNYYSRRHMTLDPNKDAKFWQFSVDQMGYYDAPALVDYILNNTGVQKLNYIGYSQGCATFFIMCSERPEYSNKINVMIGLAPATRHLNSRSIGFRLSTMAFAFLEKGLRSAGVEEVLRKGSLVQRLLATFCQLNTMTEVFCDVGLAFVDFYHPGSATNKTIANVYNHLPAGTSVKTLAQYGQSMISSDFVKFDYGRQTNMKVYGQEKPPKYKLSIVSAPVVIIYGRNDGLVDVKDVKWLAKKLPNVIDVVEVKDPLWNHLDVHHSRFTKSLIFPKIYEHLLANSH
ncbi:unnamed protein product [Diatraea saccharalis]|uniref:Lipase n=1 Tax=Diatraea saccharalis TaxID=40085 RepID=A0A9N9R9Q9_9NEOP|nr:unnamed protein product [Diatraea saccharalis]